MDGAETASGVCFLATGASAGEVCGARPEAVGLTITEFIHAYLFKELALYVSDDIENSEGSTSSGVGKRAIVEPVFTAFIFDETCESHVEMLKPKEWKKIL